MRLEVGFSPVLASEGGRHIEAFANLLVDGLVLFGFARVAELCVRQNGAQAIEQLGLAQRQGAQQGVDDPLLGQEPGVHVLGG